jgi:hypothetical protein
VQKFSARSAKKGIEFEDMVKKGRKRTRSKAVPTQAGARDFRTLAEEELLKIGQDRRIAPYVRTAALTALLKRSKPQTEAKPEEVPRQERINARALILLRGGKP